MKTFSQILRKPNFSRIAQALGVFVLFVPLGIYFLIGSFSDAYEWPFNYLCLIGFIVTNPLFALEILLSKNGMDVSISLNMLYIPLQLFYCYILVSLGAYFTQKQEQHKDNKNMP